MSGMHQNPNPINSSDVIAGRNVVITTAIQVIIDSNKDCTDELKGSTQDAVCKINKKKYISREILLGRNLLLSDAKDFKNNS